MTRLDKPLRRELLIGELAYTLTIDPEGLKLVEKGKRKGLLLSWQELVSGDAPHWPPRCALRWPARSTPVTDAARRSGPGA
jgi:hypothetical protein